MWKTLGVNRRSRGRGRLVGGIILAAILTALVVIFVRDDDDSVPHLEDAIHATRTTESGPMLRGRPAPDARRGSSESMHMETVRGEPNPSGERTDQELGVGKTVVKVRGFQSRRDATRVMVCGPAPMLFTVIATETVLVENAHSEASRPAFELVLMGDDERPSRWVRFRSVKKAPLPARSFERDARTTTRTTLLDANLASIEEPADTELVWLAVLQDGEVVHRHRFEAVPRAGALTAVSHYHQASGEVVAVPAGTVRDLVDVSDFAYEDVAASLRTEDGLVLRTYGIDVMREPAPNRVGETERGSDLRTGTYVFHIRHRETETPAWLSLALIDTDDETTRREYRLR